MRYLALLLLTGVLFAQTPAPNLHASQKAENALLKAEHEADQAALTMAQAEAQFNQLKATYQAAQKQAADANAATQAAIDEAYKENGLSKDAYSFDPANFTFSKKAPVKK